LRTTVVKAHTNIYRMPEGEEEIHL